MAKKNNKRIHRKTVVISIIIFLIVLNLIVLILIFKPPKQATTGQVIALTFENIPQILPLTTIVQDLPGKSEIELQFYNFNSGNREIDKIYTISKSKVEEQSPTNPEIKVNMHTKYIDGLTTENFCSKVQEAKYNGDFSYELNINLAKLSWKYKKMFKYKKCFGF